MFLFINFATVLLANTYMKHFKPLILTVSLAICSAALVIDNLMNCDYV